MKTIHRIIIIRLATSSASRLALMATQRRLRLLWWRSSFRIRTARIASQPDATFQPAGSSTHDTSVGANEKRSQSPSTDTT